jgi:hypothetical protein
MTTEVTIRWAAASDATATTDYQILNDAVQAGTFVSVATSDATDRGDGSYTPYTTTLNGNVLANATSLTLTDAGNFAENDYVLVRYEVIKLGPQTDNTFNGCLRAQAGTLSRDHPTGSAVEHMHESYVDTVDFTTRQVVRYKVVRVENTAESLPFEMLAVRPTLPPDATLCTVYGIVENMAGVPQAGVAVSLALTPDDSLDPSTGELISTTAQTTVTDTEGYFEVFVPRNVARLNAAELTLTIGEVEWIIASVPDVAYINFALL